VNGRVETDELRSRAYDHQMATKWCPKCRSEYREGFAVCADCGAALVDALVPTADRPKENTKMTGPFSHDDDVVEVATTNAVDAELIAARLRGAGIRAAVFGVGTAGELLTIQHVEGSRVMVRRADRHEALKLVADLTDAEAESAPIGDDELASLAEKATGWSDPSTGAVV
jgi:hypothetical protein